MSEEIVNPVLDKTAELENQYKNTCAQEVLLIEQLKQVQEKRQTLATCLDVVSSLKIDD